MAVQRSFSCNVCHHHRDINHLAAFTFGRGRALEIIDADIEGGHDKAMRADIHICHPCLSSLQKTPEVCGDGYDCSGGPNCPSDHK
jgi:hypothetical protein